MRRAVLALLAAAAPAPGAEPVVVAQGGPALAVVRAAADIEKVADADRPYQRYAWHPSPVLAAQPAAAVVAGLAAELNAYDPVIRFHANQLSRKGALRPPARVAFDLWRFDLRDYGWDAAVWEKMASRNFAFVKVRRFRNVKTGKIVSEKVSPAFWLPTEQVAYLVAHTESVTPVVMAPWFVANTSRQLTLTNEKLGYGYYDWFGFKKPQDFLDAFKIKLKDSIDLERDVLEVVSRSGVSKQNRSIESHDSILGMVIYTRDTDNETGRGNAIKFLRREDYKAKAREWYVPLPNGLPFYALTDDDLKELQDSAPDFIGADRSPLNESTDPRIHVGIACIRCHSGQVLKPVNGWARANYTIARLALNVPATFKNKNAEERRRIFEELSRQFLILSFANALNDQREKYRRKIHEASGLDADELARRFARSYHAYADDPVTLEQAARELGYTPEEVRAAFNRYNQPPPVGVGGIEAELGALVLEPSEPLPRLKWEDFYDDAQKIMLFRPAE